MRYFRDDTRLPLCEQVALWRAAAHGACINGDHAFEMRCRNTARLIKHLPPLRQPARCLVVKR